MLTKAQEEILATTFIGALSTIREKDGYISTNPVSYIWNGEEFEISTLKSRVKYRNLQADPRATLCVVSAKNFTQYVEVRGTVRMVDDPGGAYMKQQFKTLSGEEPPPDLDPPDAERVIVYLRPEQVSSPVLYGGRLGGHGEQASNR